MCGTLEEVKCQNSREETSLNALAPTKKVI
jgi:hypothetical protein